MFSHRARRVAASGNESLRIELYRQTGMSWQIRNSLVGDVLVVTLAGELSDPKATQLAARLGQLMPQIRAEKLLLDVRQLVGRPSEAETFFVYQQSLSWSWPAGVKAALLDLEERRDFARFHETTARNAGQRFTYFFDYDKAMTWLTDSAAAKQTGQATSEDA